MLDGIALGVTVGLLLGLDVGETDGVTVGLSLGIDVGEADGLLDGFALGLGESVGELDGPEEG